MAGEREEMERVVTTPVVTIPPEVELAERRIRDDEHTAADAVVLLAEVRRLTALLRLLRGRCVQLQKEAVTDRERIGEARERVTRAEALLAEFELTDTIDNSGDLDGTPCDPWVMCLHCGGPEDECDLDGKCLGSRVRAHLRAHPAVAPTEPDGASGTKETR